MEAAARNLTRTFRGVRALDGLSFRFAGPGLVGYLGPNGAGKTTTLKLFTGLLRPTSGQALVNGIDVGRSRTRAVGQLSALVETPEPFPHLTIGEFLAFVARLRGLDNEEAAARIAHLGETLALGDQGRTCGTLSTGTKQRVVLAATILPDADILLLDEPTAGLDPAEARRVRLVLRELRERKLVIMSSHILHEVAEVCDRVAFLGRGRLLLEDRVDAVVDRFGRSGSTRTEALEEAYIQLLHAGGTADP